MSEEVLYSAFLVRIRGLTFGGPSLRQTASPMVRVHKLAPSFPFFYPGGNLDAPASSGRGPTSNASSPCMHVYMYAFMHVCMYACVHVYRCLCMCMYVYVYAYAHMRVCIAVCACACMYIYIYIHTHIHACHMRMSIQYVYMHVHMRVCVWTCICIWLCVCVCVYDVCNKGK